MSDKPVAAKLLIKPNYKVLLVNAPAGYVEMLGPLPEGATVLTKSTSLVDLIQVFASSRAELEAQLEKLKKSLKAGGLLWVTYPKGTSKVKADINRDIIAAFANTVGLQAVAMISIDETWSGLRLKLL